MFHRDQYRYRYYRGCYSISKNFGKSLSENIFPIAACRACDTDTTASLAGAIYGALYGIEKIDKSLVENVQDSNYFKNIALFLLTGFGNRFASSEKGSSKLKKLRDKIQDLEEGQKVSIDLFGEGMIIKKCTIGSTITCQIDFTLGQSIYLAKNFRTGH